jgi:hypothetical protein
VLYYCICTHKIRTYISCLVIFPNTTKLLEEFCQMVTWWEFTHIPSTSPFLSSLSTPGTSIPSVQSSLTFPTHNSRLPCTTCRSSSRCWLQLFCSLLDGRVLIRWGKGRKVAIIWWLQVPSWRPVFTGIFLIFK